MINYKKKTKNSTKVQRKKNDLYKSRKLIRRQTESNKEIKENERKQKREFSTDGDFDLGRFFELASCDKIYVTSLNLHEIKNKILQDHTGDFELNGLMII